MGGYERALYPFEFDPEFFFGWVDHYRAFFAEYEILNNHKTIQLALVDIFDIEFIDLLMTD
jgi:hypothetical protein